jgi:hypothetical protein
MISNQSIKVYTRSGPLSLRIAMPEISLKEQYCTVYFSLGKISRRLSGIVVSDSSFYCRGIEKRQIEYLTR